MKKETDFIMGLNKNTYNLLFSDSNELDIKSSGSLENLIAYITIDKFTMINNKVFYLKLLKRIIKNRDNLDLDRIFYDKGTKEYIYIHDNNIYSFSKLSDHISSNKSKKELLSKKRYGICHMSSIKLSLNIKDSYVITGYITIGKNRFLHSVVEVVENDEIFILDWTRNFKMLKEDYVELTKFNELSRIKSSEVLNDYDKIISNFGIGIKAYLVYRDEIIKELDNKMLLKK